MTLLYKAYQSTVESEDGTKKWFPRLVKFGERVETDQLGDEIAEKSSLTRGDVGNTVDNLISVMGRHLMDGKSVNLRGLGTFTAVIRARGNGVDSADDVSDSQINGISIRFTPSYTRNNVEGTTRAMFKGVSFQRIDLKESEQSGGGSGSGSGDPNA